MKYFTASIEIRLNNPIPTTRSKSYIESDVRERSFWIGGKNKAIRREKMLTRKAMIKYLFERRFIRQIGALKFFKEKVKNIESIDSPANIIVLTSSIGRFKDNKIKYKPIRNEEVITDIVRTSVLISLVSILLSVLLFA